MGCAPSISTTLARTEHGTSASTPSGATTPLIDALAECFRSLSQLGASLDESQWKTATDLPQWSVQDNLSHLIAIERRLAGLPGTAHRTTQLAHVRNPLGENNEHEVDSRRALRGRQVLDEWDEITATRMASLRAADEAFFAQAVDTPAGPGTMADFISIRILDCWLHEQDMRRALGVPGHLSGAAAGLTVDRLIQTLPIVVGKRAATPEGGAVVIDIIGTVTRHVVCEVRDGRAAVVDSPTRSPLATITLDLESFVVLATGRRGAADVAAAVTGDEELAGRVLDHLNMMI